jgi:amino acid transporter
VSTSAPPRSSQLSTALARDRLGVPSVVFFVMSAAAPLTVVAGVVPTALAVTGLTGMAIGFLAVAVVLAIFSVGYVAMARHIANAGAFYAYISRGIGRPLVWARPGWHSWRTTRSRSPRSPASA